MGCFVSTNRATSSQPPRKDHAVVAQRPKPSESSIVTPHAEEETVKEVLSETAKWKSPTTSKSELQKPHQNKTLHKLQEEEEEEEKEESKDEKKASLHVHRAQGEEASEVSEVCSLVSETMSMSTTTTTTTEQREQEVEETRKRVIRSPTKLRKNRSFSGDLGGCKRERKVHASRNNGVVGSARLAQCRDQVGQRIVDGGVRNQPRWRDPGETSFRRSRLPATSATSDGAATSVVGRCPSARRTNGPPATATGTSAPENGRRKMEVPAREGKRVCANETLENPLVSLECFIFI